MKASVRISLVFAFLTALSTLGMASGDYSSYLGVDVEDVFNYTQEWPLESEFDFTVTVDSILERGSTSEIRIILGPEDVSQLIAIDDEVVWVDEGDVIPELEGRWFCNKNIQEKHRIVIGENIEEYRWNDNGILKSYEKSNQGVTIVRITLKSSGGIPGYPAFMLACAVVVAISLISLARQKRLLG